MTVEGRAQCVEALCTDIVSISAKAYKITTFYGSTAIIPSSQVFHVTDYGDGLLGVWCPGWIFRKKNVIFDRKKKRYLRAESSRIIVMRHVPQFVEPVASNLINDLKR